VQHWVGVGGVKVIAPPNIVVRPYGIGGFGVGYSKLKVKALGMDFSEGLADELGEDVLSYTKPMFEVEGGVAVPLGRVYIDASYRFRKALNIDDTNMSGIYVGGGVSY
jgi:opacity protein-like surface antigen